MILANKEPTTSFTLTKRCVRTTQMCKQQDSVIMSDLHFRSTIIQVVTLRSHGLQNWFAKLCNCTLWYSLKAFTMAGQNVGCKGSTR